ncbi:MAG: TonB-dependent receptor plug domain-containing protein [Flavobacteriales bacterium]
MIFFKNEIAAKFFGLCCFFMCTFSVFGQEDTLTEKGLSVIKILAFPENERLAKIPGTVALLSEERWSANDQTSLQNTLNSVPGVSMESRGYGGSQRINIRGNFLRNPFAVRNVKMYLSGIPLSSPDGTAPLEMIDAFDIGSMEVLKGPIGSLYGSGTGGALLIAPKLKIGGRPFTANAGVLVGEYGLFRSQNEIYWRKEKLIQRLSAVYQENKGYREQEFNRKMNVTYLFRSIPTYKRSLTGYFNFFNGNLGLPGSLNATQVELDPQQANTFSKNNNAALYRTRLFGGLSQAFYWLKGIVLNLSVYGMYAQKYNPYGTSASYSQNGYKDEETVGYGTRTNFIYTFFRANDLVGRLGVGGELQLEHFDGTEWTNVLGRPGDLKYNYQVDYLSWLGFVSTDFEWKRFLFLNVGASINQTRHNISATTASFTHLDSLATWSPKILPRIALLYQPLRGWSAHGSISYGNSNPTVNEQVEIQQLSGVTGFSESYGLLPEHGINYEIGIKKAYRTRWLFEVTGYYFNLKQAILPFNKEVFFEETQTTEEFTYYSNAGRLSQKGLEFSVNYEYVNDGLRLFPKMNFYVNGQLTEYTFGAYQLDGNEHAGNRIPGMPYSSLNSGIKLSTELDRFALSIQHNYVDRIPINNANTAWTNPYHLLHLRVDSSPKVLQKVSKSGNVGAVKLSFGINNVLNTHYTSFLQTNGFGGRYYNPAPVRNYFVAITLQLD